MGQKSRNTPKIQPAEVEKGAKYKENLLEMNTSGTQRVTTTCPV